MLRCPSRSAATAATIAVTTAIGASAAAPGTAGDSCAPLFLTLLGVATQTVLHLRIRTRPGRLLRYAVELCVAVWYSTLRPPSSAAGLEVKS